MLPRMAPKVKPANSSRRMTSPPEVVERQEPDGHDNHVAIAGGLERRNDVVQGVRIPYGHQHIAGPG